MLYGIAQFKKYDPGAQCGIEYSTMYCKFARMQNSEFLIFVVGFLLSKAKNVIKMLQTKTWFHVSPEIIIELYVMYY